MTSNWCCVACRRNAAREPCEKPCHVCAPSPANKPVSGAIAPFRFPMQAFFARHDWHWDDVSSYFFDGPLLGNGLLGAVLHRRDVSRGGDRRTLLWEFNRSDAIDTG